MTATRTAFARRHLSLFAFMAAGLAAPLLLLAPRWVAYSVIAALVVALIAAYRSAVRRDQEAERA